MWSTPNCGRICGQKRFPPKPAIIHRPGREAFSAFHVGWIVTLRAGECKSFLREGKQVPCCKQGKIFTPPQSRTASVFYFSGRVNLHLGYVLQPQNCPYFPRRRTSSPPQNGHFSLISSICCCFSASLLLVKGCSFCTSCMISSGEYKFSEARSCVRSFFSISGRRTIMT